MRNFLLHGKYTTLFTLLFASLFLAGCMGADTADPYSRRYTASDINPSPHILNNTIVKGTDLSGLHLENTHIKDATFFNTTAKGVIFKNVVFDNCRFINARFDRALMENVLFKGGVLTCENDAANHQKRTAFTNSQFTALVLDGTYLENTVFEGDNSTIILRNVKNVMGVSPLITGKNVHLTIQNSFFRHMVVAEVTGASSLIAVNSTFYHANFGKSIFKDTAFSKNTTYGGPFYEVKGRTTQHRIR